MFLFDFFRIYDWTCSTVHICACIAGTYNNFLFIAFCPYSTFTWNGRLQILKGQVIIVCRIIYIVVISSSSRRIKEPEFLFDVMLLLLGKEPHGWCRVVKFWINKNNVYRGSLRLYVWSKQTILMFCYTATKNSCCLVKQYIPSTCACKLRSVPVVCLSNISYQQSSSKSMTLFLSTT